MRFFKIFLVAFFSLVGTVALIVGGMYLFGALTPEKIEPENIYFEYDEGKTEFYLSNDTNIKISTSTSEVTEKSITLSFVNGSYSDNEADVNGYISNGIIKVPQKVTIGQSFKVQLVKESNSELGGEEWIKGGSSTLRASSESLQASNIETVINVDVPVKRITIKTYASYDFEKQQCQTEKTSFATGETFYAEAEFVPKESKYKYGNEELGTKNVYFDIKDLGNTITEDEDVCKDFANGKNNVIALTALKSSTNTKINGYVFSNIGIEEQIALENGNNTDAMLQELKKVDSYYTVSQTESVQFVSVSVNSITVKGSTTQKTLKFNSVNQIFANYGSSSSALNLGIQITGVDNYSETQYLQSKIEDVKLTVYIKSGENYIEANDDTYLFLDKSTKQTVSNTDKQYSPIIVSDINRSYWNFVPLLDNAEYAFVLTLDDDHQVATYSAQNTQLWKSSPIVASSLSWTDNSPVTLSVIDSTDPEKILSEEFDLQSILSKSLGTYTRIQYIAYTEANVTDLSDVIIGAKLSSIKYNNLFMGLQDEYNIYELNSSVIKLQPTTLKSFNVRAVILKTDYNNLLNGTREVVAYSSDLVVNIQKTVQNLSVNIKVSDPTLLKNLPTGDDKVLTQLAFVPTEIKQNIFDFVFTVECDSAEQLNADVEIFLEDFENGKIYISQQSIGQQTQIIKLESETSGNKVSDTKWQFIVHAYTTEEILTDTTIWFEYVYKQTSKQTLNEFVKTVEFDAEKNEFEDVTYNSDASQVVVDIYDGKIYTLEYEHNHNQRQEDGKDESYIAKLTETTQIEASESYETLTSDDDKVYVATNLSRQYEYEKDKTATDVTNDDGSYKIIAKDKYGNTIESAKYTFEKSNVEGEDFEMYTCVKVVALNYSSSLQNDGTQAPYDSIYITSAESSGNTIVRANEGQIKNGSWSKSSYSNYVTIDSAKPISITRYGYTGSTFDINGSDGLLSIIYECKDKKYELNDIEILKYTLPSLDAYANVIEYSEDDGKISVNVLTSLARDVNLLITATSELGESYVINLTIEKNISISLTRLTDQLNLEEQNSDNQFCLYSNNVVEYEVTVTYTCQEITSGSEQIGAKLNIEIVNNTNSFVSFDYKEQISYDFFDTKEFSSKDQNAISTKSFYVNFSSYQIGNQKIVISTDAGKTLTHAFSCEIEFNVTPNIAFANNQTITKNVVISNNSVYENVLSTDDISGDNTILKRIVGSEEIKLEELAIAFDKVNSKDAVYLNGNSTPITDNIFSLKTDSTNKQICLLNDKTMEGVYNEEGLYYAIVKLQYGNYEVGTVRVNIHSSITPNYESEYADNRFIIYNSSIYLALVGGETITLTGSESSEYIKNLFMINSDSTNNPDIALSISANLATNLDSENNKYQINKVSDYVTSSTDIVLTLTHRIGTKNVAVIQFPVIIMPFGADYVRYNTQPTFNNNPVDDDKYLVDMSSLNSYQQLSTIKVDNIDTFTCGTTISLFQNASQNFGFSQEILNRINSSSDNKLKLSIRYAGEYGQITNTEYRNNIDTAGNLALDSSATDTYLYAVLYDSQNVKQLGLYKFLIKADVKINVNYPYVTKDENDYVEYIQYHALNEENNIISLNGKFEKNYPNYNKKRVELDSITTGQEIADSYTINYSIFSVDGKENIGDGILSNQYGLYIDKKTSKFYLSTTNSYTVVLKAEVVQHNLVVGAVYYTMQINKQPQASFVLHDADDSVYNITSLTIDANESFDYSRITLYTLLSGQTISSPASEELKYYYYIVNDPDNTATYLKNEDKELSLDNDKVVSDKIVNFVFYTIYGPVHTITLNFKSVYDYNLIGSAFTETSKGNYEILADKTFKLSEQFQAQNGSYNINLENVVYTLDGVKNSVSETDAWAFTQNQVGKHEIKIVADLAGKTDAEKFIFTINIDVKASITSTHKTSEKALKINDENSDYLVYSVDYQDGLTVNNIFGDKEANAENVLFKIEDFSVLNGYKLKIVSSSNCADYLSFEEEDTLSDSVDSNYVYLIKILKSPKDYLNVELTFTLIKDNQNIISAKLKFVVVPDILVTFNYPQPNSSTKLDYEARFLDSNGGTFAFATDDLYFSSEKRIVLTDREENEITDTSRISRITIKAESSGAIHVKGYTSWEFTLFDEGVDLEWGASGAQTNMSCDVNFGIWIDGVLRDTYKITFYNNINTLFAIDNIYNLYQDQEENEYDNPEIFYATCNPIEAIFSYNTAILSFKSTGTEANLTAYIKKSESSELTDNDIIGTLHVGPEISSYSWLLINNSKDSEDEYLNNIKEDFSNIIIKVENDNNEYTVKTLTSIIQADTAKLTYRLGLTYLGYDVDYEKMANELEVDSTPILSYTPSLLNATDSNTIEFKLFDEVLTKKYYYSVVYDFKCNSENDNYNVAAGTTYESGNSYLGITTLDGTQFTAEYFSTKGVYYYAELAMITKVGFEQNQIMDNVIYASSDKLAILKASFPNFTALTSKASIYEACVAVARTPLETGSKNFYDFELTALGAENAGNYAYILVTYSTDEAIGKGTVTEQNITDKNLAYALVKVFVEPDEESIRLLNTDLTLNGSGDKSRQVITYDKSTSEFLPITLGNYGSEAEDYDLIFVEGANGKNVIAPYSDDTTHQTTLTLYGDIADYAYLETIPGYNAILKQKNTGSDSGSKPIVAHYGNKEGYILVKDMYGYEAKYYLRLEALADQFVLSLPDDSDQDKIFINTIENMSNTYFAGTEMVIIDADASVSLGETGAIRINNFNQISNQGWNYHVTYNIYDAKTDDLIFNKECGDNQTQFELPTLKDTIKNVTLQIIITITTTSDVQEFVTLSASMKIQKRFILTTSSNNDTASVQSGVEFTLDDYFTVQDVANTSTTLGTANISGNTLTLLVPESQKDKKIYVSLAHKTDKTANYGFAITAGKDFSSNDMTSAEIGSENYYIYPLAKHTALKSIDFDYYNVSLINQGYNSPINISECKFIADKIVSLATSKLSDGDEKYVYVKVQKDKLYYVSFTLDKNGTQEKSLVEAIANGQFLDSAEEDDYATFDLEENFIEGTNQVSTYGQTKTLYDIELSTTPVSVQDLNKIKNFEIYDDNIKLKFQKVDGIEDITVIDYTITISVKTDDNKTTVLKEKTYAIEQNFNHTKYISLYSLIGDALNTETTYIINIAVTSPDTSKGIVYYCYKDTDDVEQNVVVYSKETFTGFKCISKTTTDEDTTNRDLLTVDSEEAFADSRIYQVPKSYIIKYIDQGTDSLNILEQVKLTYNVTPRYYAIDNYQNESSKIKTIYANQYTRDEDGKYIIEFNTWASPFNLINLAGDTLASLNNGKGLDFKVIKGSGSINKDNNALETDAYSFGDEFIISVSVEVIEGEGKYVSIGQVYVNIDRDNVYVTYLAKYLVTVTHPETGATSNGSYDFTQNIVSLTNLLSVFDVEDGKIQLSTGVSKEISECNIDIITVVQGIYSAEYVYDNAEYLRVKLKLNEISSTYGQKVTLQFQGESTKNTAGIVATKTFTVKEKESNKYEFNNIEKQTRNENTGLLTIDIPYNDLFTAGTIGEDYTYSVKVVSTGNTNSNYLYAKRDITADEIKTGNILFFAFSFTDDKKDDHNTILAVQKSSTSITELFKNDGYFTINLENIQTIDEVAVLYRETENDPWVNKISCYSITYLGAYDLVLAKGKDILFSVVDGGCTYYSIGKVKNYSDISPFEINIQSTLMYEKLVANTENLSIAVYTDTVINESLPSVVTFTISGQGVYGVYTNDISNLKIFAITSESKSVNADLSSLINNLESYEMLTIVDYTDRVTENVTGTSNYWKVASNKFIKVAVTLNDKTDYKLYAFDINPLSLISSNENITPIEKVHLESLVNGNITNGQYYNFSVTLPDMTIQYIAIKAENNELIYTPTSDSGLYTFSYQNVTNANGLSAGLVNYKLKDNNNNLLGIYCVRYTSSSDMLICSSNPLYDGATSAIKYDDTTLEISCVSGSMNYIELTLEPANTTEYIVTMLGEYNVALSLTAGQFMRITNSTSGFENFNGSQFTLYVQVDSENDQTFNVNWGGNATDIEVEAGESSKEFSSTTDFTIGTSGKKLTITK